MTAAHTVEVVVRGPLWPALRAALEDFEIRTDADGLTVIVGPVADQARLFGLLGLFDGLNIEVVSVNRMDPPAR
jgi:hypothetical protein